MLETDTLRAWAEVDYGAIAHNVKEIKKLMGKTKIMGIVKADAYGHGDVACAYALQDAGVGFFAVACVEEAINLREAGIEDPILILGYTAPGRFHFLRDFNLIQTVISLDYAKKLSKWAKDHGCEIEGHVKVDTGMNRTGVQFQETTRHFDELKEIYSLPNLKLTGIFSHFPVSDNLDEDSIAFTKKQMEYFDAAINLLKAQGINPGVRHIQNSYGILNYGDKGYDYCRPGLLYMGVTSDDQVPILSNPDFIPIMSLKAKVTMVKTIQPGATVSYGRHYKADSERKIASISIGYADGLPRSCSNKGLEVLIRGKRAKIVGNICMDQCMADVTDIDGVQEGDIVTIVGKDGNETVTIDEISRLAGTINNESLTRLTDRVVRLDVSQ